METVFHERRKQQSTITNVFATESERAVRQAILIQATVGMRGAVEYMKVHQAHSAVIGRVLPGGAVRALDQRSRDNPVAYD